VADVFRLLHMTVLSSGGSSCQYLRGHSPMASTV